jgi:hypothetical protein
MLPTSFQLLLVSGSCNRYALFVSLKLFSCSLQPCAPWQTGLGFNGNSIPVEMFAVDAHFHAKSFLPLPNVQF